MSDESRALPKVGGVLHRALSAREVTVDAEARTVELSFSSEEPYERSWGIEILDHDAKSVDLGRLNDGAAVLVNHDPNDQVGVVVKAEVGPDRKGRAIVRFGRGARAQEVFQDVQDGIRTLVSVGYRIDDVAPEKGARSDTYRVTRWTPFEVSLVAVPADATVGVGRSQAHEEPQPPVIEVDKTMTEVTAAPAPAVDVAAERAAERERIKILNAMGTRLDASELAQKAIDSGASVDEFVREYEKVAGPAKAIKVAESAEIGLTEKEARSFSFVRAMNALANPKDRRAQEAAGFELECSRAAADKSHKTPQGLLVPVDVLKRDLTVGTATAGGHTVATDLLSGSFIDMLRNRMVILGLGTRLLTDLNGNIAIPRQTGGATAYWVAESGSPTESQQAFDQVAMSPKTLGAFTDISRKLLIQSSIDVEALVRSDIATTIALAIQTAAINGSGSSNQPTGILQVAGIGSVAGGTNGAAPTYENMVGLETQVAQDDADVGTLGYLTNTKVRGKLKTTQVFSGTNGAPVWQGNTVNGYNAAVTNAVPSTLTKGTASGTCSAIIFGNWADLLIGMWSGLDLMVDPYTGSTSGTVRVVGLQDVDVAVRHPESFAAMVDALTA